MGVPDKFDILGFLQGGEVALAGTQGVPAVDEVDLFAELREREGFSGCGVAAARHCYHLVLVIHSVAGGTVSHALPCQGLLVCKSQFAGGGTGGKQDGTGGHLAACGGNHLGVCEKVAFRDGGEFARNTEALCAQLHFFAQLESINAVFEAGVIVNLCGGCHLTTGT